MDHHVKRRLRLPGAKKTHVEPKPAAVKLLKTYVWRDVFCDYTCGVAVAVASSISEARQLLLAERIRQWGGSERHAADEIDRELTDRKCEIYPAGHTVAVISPGGG